MNNIQKCDLKTLKNLESLVLSGNKLENLQQIDFFPELKELDVSKNLIENIDFLNSRVSLSIFKCNYNKLYDWETVVDHLKQMENLEELELIGNDVTLHKNYDTLVLELPNLKVLDGVPVSERKKDHLKVKSNL